MAKLIKLFTLFMLSVFHSSCGQTQIVPHKDPIDYSIKDTVTSYGPLSMVRNVKQDRNGNILFAASWGGVFRYDGRSFTNITSKIGSRRYWDVLEDRRGNLWFASTDSGVYKYNGKTFHHFTAREGLASNLVQKIYEDRAGNIWFGTGVGASRFDGNSFRNFTTKDGLPHNGVRAILEDKTGKVWIGTEGGLGFYDGKTFTVLKSKDGKPFKNIWSIIEDQKGNIWFGEAYGLWRYDGRISTQVSQRGAYGIFEDKKGNIWTSGSISPYDGPVWALSRYDAKSLYNKTPTVTDIRSAGRGDCLGILEANDGSIWFGSMTGVYRYDGKTITDFKTKGGMKQ